MDLSNHWKTIVNTVHDGLMVVDAKGKIVAINPAVEELTGYKAGDLVGRSCRVLNCTGCHIKKDHPDLWCRLFVKGAVQSKRCTITHKEGREIQILKTASVLRDQSGKIVGAVESLTDITESLQQQSKIDAMRKSLNLEEGYHDLVGRSQIMQQMFELIENVAHSDAPVLIQGQSGTGKELVAMAIHEASPRRDNSFIKVNCAALNENLLESELFGHVKGAFTGADRVRVGRFEAAHEGTIFLDEIGDIPLSTQVKLLRVLEENVIERVGDHRPIPVDVRIVSATNKDLDAQMAEGLFREDLYFRINVFPIHCPSLAERRDDIPLLVENFIRHGIRKSQKKITGITADAMETLTTYAWPGNVRELRNIIDYAMVLCPGGNIGSEHLPAKIKTFIPGDSIKKTTVETEKKRQQIIQALVKSGGNQSQAAGILGVSRVTIWKWLKKYNIDPNAIYSE